MTDPVSFNANEINCSENECSLLLGQTKCISPSDTPNNIWFCEDPRVKKNNNTLISARAYCNNNQTGSKNTCILKYSFNDSIHSPQTGHSNYSDYPDFPKPPNHQYPFPDHSGPDFVIWFFLIFFLLFFFLSLISASVRRSSQTHPHPHPTSTRCSNQQCCHNQEYCDNPLHFNIKDDAPPPYEAINQPASSTTPLLSNRSKYCLEPRCPNYLKPFPPRSFSNRGISYQSVPSILVNNPGLDYYHGDQNNHYNHNHHHNGHHHRGHGNHEGHNHHHNDHNHGHHGNIDHHNNHNSSNHAHGISQHTDSSNHHHDFSTYDTHHNTHTDTHTDTCDTSNTHHD